MHDITLEEAVEIGLRFHRNGQLREAEDIYQQVLRHDPRNADAMHLMGVLAQQAKQSAVSVEMIRRAIEVKPDAAVFHFNLAEAYRALEKFAESEQALRRAVELEPEYADAYNHLAIVLLELERAAEAEAACRNALDIDAEHIAAWGNLGNALRVQKRFPEAIAAYEEGNRLQPGSAESWNNLGLAHGQSGNYHAAVEALLTAARLKPELADTHHNLGLAYLYAGRRADAHREFTTAVRLQPDFAEAKVNLATMLREEAKADQAVAICREVLAANEDFLPARSQLAIALKDLYLYDEATEQAAKVLAVRPKDAEMRLITAMMLKDQKRSTAAREILEELLVDHPNEPMALNCLGMIDIEQGDADAGYENCRRSAAVRFDLQTASNFLLAINYLPRCTPEEVATEHLAWGQAAEAVMQPLRRTWPPRAVGVRKVRVGYISPDFRHHPVAYFVQSFLKHHDPEQFEVYGFAHLTRPDVMTLHLQTLIPHWRFITGRTHQTVMDMIAEDEIDILVDLAGHTGGNSLPIFAARAAPIQVSMVGYPNTTGLKTVDYRITDARLDPPGQTEAFSSETLHRMPDAFWCYTPDEHAPPVVDRAPEPRAIRFCSMNNPAKVNQEVVAAWADILLRTPGSTLMIQGGGMEEARAHERISRQFKEAGVDLARVDFRSSTVLGEYYRRMSECDVALDTFPYNGGTTTCHKLWMGLPVVAFAGSTHVARMGYSILNCVGLGDLCGKDVGEYIEIAVRLAQDTDRLRELRLTMRDRLRASPLLDEQAYTTHLENAFRSFCGR